MSSKNFRAGKIHSKVENQFYGFEGFVIVSTQCCSLKKDQIEKCPSLKKKT